MRTLPAEPEGEVFCAYGPLFAIPHTPHPHVVHQPHPQLHAPHDPQGFFPVPPLPPVAK